MSAPPILWKIIRYVLYSTGAGMVVSGAVNIAAAYSLIESAEEQSLGITRGDFVTWFGAMGLAGIGLILLGWKLGRRAKAKPRAR
jgi:hypothetical protein